MPVDQCDMEEKIQLDASSNESQNFVKFSFVCGNSDGSKLYNCKLSTKVIISLELNICSKYDSIFAIFQ